MFSSYCASKWAVEGFSEAVSKEVKPEWGIKLQCVEPGGFRYATYCSILYSCGPEVCECPNGVSRPEIFTYFSAARVGSVIPSR